MNKIIASYNQISSAPKLLSIETLMKKLTQVALKKKMLSGDQSILIAPFRIFGKSKFRSKKSKYVLFLSGFPTGV